MDDGGDADPVPSTSGAAPPQHVGGSPEALWKNFGRDNPAGKALYKLYSKDAAKQAGSQYHGRNKQLHDQKVASGWSPPPEPPKPKYEKPQVAVPKFYKKGDCQEAGSTRHIPRRKPYEAIRKEVDEEYARMRATPSAPPKGPELGDREKERLATLMRFRGKPPAVTPEEVALIARNQASRHKQQSQAEQLSEMFEAVLQEIEERRQFLRDLEAAGALKAETMHQVRAEIQQRCAELERIDMLMQKADGLPGAPGGGGGANGRAGGPAGRR